MVAWPKYAIKPCKYLNTVKKNVKFCNSERSSKYMTLYKNM